VKFFFTADQHFNHKKIIQMCLRPFGSVEAMNEELIRLHNSVVSPEDTIFCLGDFGFGSVEDLGNIVSRLNGHLVLVRGNHDGTRTRCLKVGFKDVVNPPFKHLDGTVLVHDPYAALGLTETRVLCGHIHNLWKDDVLWHNVGVDVRDFTPVTMDQIIEVGHG